MVLALSTQEGHTARCPHRVLGEVASFSHRRRSKSVCVGDKALRVHLSSGKKYSNIQVGRLLRQGI